MIEDGIESILAQLAPSLSYTLPCTAPPRDQLVTLSLNRRTSQAAHRLRFNCTTLTVLWPKLRPVQATSTTSGAVSISFDARCPAATDYIAT